MTTLEPTVAPLLRTWRIATAARVFVLALITGQALTAPVDESTAGVLLALALVAAACCVAELPPGTSSASFVPAAEGVAAVVLLVLAMPPSPSPLAVYLVLPASVAGIRHGVRTALVAGAVTSGAVAAAALCSWFGVPAADPARLFPWLVVGLGVGLLAAHQTHAARELAASWAPYASARHLVGRLHSLVSAQDLDLGVSSVCRTLQEETRAATGATRSGVWISGDQLELVARHGAPRADDHRLAVACLESGDIVSGAGCVVVPLRMGNRAFGALLLGGPDLDRRGLRAAQVRADAYAVRLDTAVLVEEVRSSATADERRRLARDIHDGVAQRIVSLGYLADELLDEVQGSEASTLAEEVRCELERIVDELRFSVYDLHDDVAETDGVSAALSSYVQELSGRSGLRVHLSLDERGDRLPRRTETELVRIAREAIGNVHRHARAVNLWVRLTTNGELIRLEVEDDGVGNAVPRAGHYGLHTMRERADRIAADLVIEARHDGGTRVSLHTRTAETARVTEESTHDHRLARR